MSSLLPLLLLAQVGPSTATDPVPSSAVPPEMLDQRRMRHDRQGVAADAMPVVTSDPDQPACVDAVGRDPAGAEATARDALARASGDERLRAGLCLGVALSDLGRFDEARAAFVTARDSASATDAASKARLGAMAGNAALAAGNADEALSLLQIAQASAKTAGDTDLGGSIATDRARALVAAGRNDEAVAALSDARMLAPDNAQAWLLAATLSRRMNRLDDAQAEIEQASRLDSSDPQIGLEAGVIAVLAGRDEAARRSWQSVLALAPGSAEATTAQGYIAQLGPAPAAAAAPAPAPAATTAKP